MATNLIVTFHMIDTAGDEVGTVQFHDALIVPAVGEICRVVTSRDSNGNYSSDGKPQRRWDGMVLKREFSYEIHGRNPAAYRPAVFVDVYIEMLSPAAYARFAAPWGDSSTARAVERSNHKANRKEQP